MRARARSGIGGMSSRGDSGSTSCSRRYGARKLTIPTLTDFLSGGDQLTAAQTRTDRMVNTCQQEKCSDDSPSERKSVP